MDTSEMKVFGEVLATHRKEAKLSQEELAERLDVSQQAVTNWESGENLPDTKEIVLQVAQALNLDDDDITHLLKVAGFHPSLPIWFVPHTRNSFFTGREEILQNLHSSLKSEKTVVLTNSQELNSHGGIGKTQIAIEYAYRYRLYYDAVVWLQADTREILFSELARLADALGLPERRSQNQNLSVQAVIDWLEVNTEWLIILDNVEDISLIREFFHLNHTGYVLLITDQKVMELISSTRDPDSMTEQDGILFLLRRSHIISFEASTDQIEEALYTQAKQLWELMDGLPLALDMAAAYILETGCEIAAYCELHQKRRSTWLRRRGFPSGYPESAFTAIVLSLEKVKQVNRASLELLRVCTFLHPDAIPVEIFVTGAKYLGPILSEVAAHTMKLGEAITILRNYSLVQYDLTSQTISLHRFIQSVIQETLNAEIVQPWAGFVVQAVAATIPELNQQNWLLYERYLTHARKCRDLINEHSISSKQVADLLENNGDYLYQHARYTEAVPFFSSLLTLHLERFGDQHPVVAWTLEDLGDVHRELDNFEIAETFYLRAVSIWHQYQSKYKADEVLQEKEVLLNQANVSNKLALVFINDQKFDNAATLYQNMLTQQSGFDQSVVAYNLAELYRQQDKYAEAEPLYLRALQIREKRLGSNHPEVAYMLNGLANLYCQEGKYTEAEPLYLQSLQIREQQLGSDHLEVAHTLYGLANLYRQQGKYAEAELLYLRALQIREQQLGSDHLEVASPLNGLANLYRQQGKYTEAEPFFQRILAIFERNIGQEHPMTQNVRESYASVLRAMGRNAEAKQLEGGA